MESAIRKTMDLSPTGIRRHLDLNRPIYAKTSAYGHFGRKAGRDGSFSWEKLDLVKPLERVDRERLVVRQRKSGEPRGVSLPARQLRKKPRMKISQPPVISRGNSQAGAPERSVRLLHCDFGLGSIEIMDAELDEENDVRPLPQPASSMGKNDMTETRGARATEAFLAAARARPCGSAQAAHLETWLPF